MSSTLKTVFERLAEKTNPGHPVLVTASSGSTTTIVSTTAEYSKTATTADNGKMAVCTSNANSAGNAPEGESRRISNWASSTKTWTVEAFSSAVEASDTFAIIGGLVLADYKDAINTIIRNLPLDRFLPLPGLIADGHMEGASADVATDWPDQTAVGTVTQTKETSIVLTGKQSLKLVFNTLNDSARSLSCPVTEGQQLFLSAPVKCTAGSLNVQLYDVTNSAEIESVTVDEEAWTEVRFQGVVPSDCQNVQVRFIAKTASTTAYVDYCQLLTPSEVWTLGTLSVDEADILGVYYLPAGYTSEAAMSYEALSRRLEPWEHVDGLRDYMGVVPQRIQITAPTLEPLFVKFKACDSALSTMASTTIVPLETLIAGAEEILWRKKGDMADSARDTERAKDYERNALRAGIRFQNHLGSKKLGQPTASIGVTRRV